jgi:HEAT repeat protein
MLSIKDTGFIPEAELIDRTNSGAAYDYMRSEEVDLENLIDVADAATSADPDDIPALIEFLKSEDAAIRYWGATGLLIQEEGARPALEELKVAAKDASASVVVVAGETLYRLGEKEAGKQALLTALKSPNAFARAHALNAIDALGESSKEIQDGVIAMVKNLEEMNQWNYDWRSAKGLLTRWKVDLKKNGIELL